MTAQKTYVLLNSDDNILVSCRDLAAGESLLIDNHELILKQAVPVGHKIARLTLERGAKIIKYGAPIGSALTDISIGEHVHLHNMKSDYISSHTRSSISRGD